jgi:hypothetical protein
MKKTFLFLLLSTLSVAVFSQSKSKGISMEEEVRNTDKYSVIYIQLISEEDVAGKEVKFRLELGHDNRFYIKNKIDFEVFDQIQGGIAEAKTIPDALNYLREKGFRLESGNSVIYGSIIRHDYILSRTTMK